ncbi:MAG: hypothetical protein OHK0038_10740 [Flammeovirgaceae bacterium]
MPILALGLNSCSDDEEATPTEDGANAFQVTSYSESVSNEADEIYKLAQEEYSNGRVSGCGTFSYDEQTKTVMMDFGTTGCTSSETGKTIKGKVSYQFTGEPQTGNFSGKITFETFSVDGNTITGTMTYSIELATLNVTTTMSNVKITGADGKSITITSSNSVSTYNNGGTAQNPDDDSFSITTTSSGITKDGTTYSTKTNSPMITKISCVKSGFYYPVSGEVEVTVGKVVSKIDWGTGTCDKTVTITTGGLVETKTLP